MSFSLYFISHSTKFSYKNFRRTKKKLQANHILMLHSPQTPHHVWHERNLLVLNPEFARCFSMNMYSKLYQLDAKTKKNRRKEDPIFKGKKKKKKLLVVKAHGLNSFSLAPKKILSRGFA